MKTPTIELECYFGPLDGQTIRVDAWAEVVHWWGHLYHVERDEDGSRVLRYVGTEPVAA